MQLNKFSYSPHHYHEKNRSISLSRIQNGSTRNKNVPMVLNKDILDAIRNRRYKLKHVDNDTSSNSFSPIDASSTSNMNLIRGRRMYHSMKQFPNMHAKDSKYFPSAYSDEIKGNIIANILRRRVSMEYMNDSDDTEDESLTFS